MSVQSDNINWYNKNVLRDFKYWDLLKDSSVTSDGLVIRPGGYAGLNLSGDYYNGLNESRYRKVVLRIDENLTSSNNYKNLICAEIRCKYKSDDTIDAVTGFYVVSLTNRNRYKDKILSMESSDIDEMSLVIVNRSTGNITVTTCEMYRSQDINSSQVGESIGFGITLNKVIAYLDGCEIFYDGVETPDKLWWTEDDQGVFAGINVNNERLIKFERKNEILLD